MKRRFFLLAAPAIVAAPSLMRVSVSAFAALDLSVLEEVWDVDEMARIATERVRRHWETVYLQQVFDARVRFADFREDYLHV